METLLAERAKQNHKHVLTSESILKLFPFKFATNLGTKAVTHLWWSNMNNSCSSFVTNTRSKASISSSRPSHDNGVSKMRSLWQMLEFVMNMD